MARHGGVDDLPAIDLVVLEEVTLRATLAGRVGHEGVEAEQLPRLPEKRYIFSDSSTASERHSTTVKLGLSP